MSPSLDVMQMKALIPLFAKGLAMTVFLAALCNTLAIVIAYGLAAALHFRVRILSGAIRFYLSLIINTPLLVQIYVVYFGMPEIGITADSTVSGIIVLTLWASAYQTANLRGALGGVPRHLTETARALGLRPANAFLFIIVPVATRIVLPAMANTMISTIKNSALLSAIGVPELTFVAMDNIAETYRTFENFLALFVGYLALVLSLSAAMAAAERLLARGDRR